MFTGTPEELREREEQARLLAQQAAELLNEIEALGLAPGGGQIRTPGGLIRRTGPEGWTLTDR